MEEIEKIIIDIGTYETKVGFAGHEIPYKSFPSIYGYIKSSNVMGLEPERLNGSEAKMKRGNYHIKNLIQNQKVVDWDEMISFLEHCFYNQARTDTEEVIVALSEYPLTSEKERMKKTEIIFETFNSLGLYLGNSAFLSLVASGRDTGLVLDSGYEMTYVVPILRGSPLNPSIVSDNYGGKTITEFLLKKLRERTDNRANKQHDMTEKDKECFNKLNQYKQKYNDIFYTTSAIFWLGSMPLYTEKFSSPTIFRLKQALLKIRPWKGMNSTIMRFAIVFTNMSYWSLKSYDEYTKNLIPEIAKLDTQYGKKLRSM
eukprot:gene4720-8304_t